MKRVMCVYLPQWPLQHLWQRRPELRGKPVAIAQRQVKGARVSLCCAQAARAGVKPGMPVAEALAVHRRLYIEEEDAAGDRQALERLAEWAQRFSPIAGVDAEAQSLLLDISGCAACFHGEDRLARQASRELKGLGWTAQLAVADTLGAAWAMAHCLLSLHERTPFAERKETNWPYLVPSGETETALAPLPIAALRLPEEAAAMLAALGIEHIAELAALPRSSIPGRFGLLVLERLDQAMGRLAEPIVPHQPLPDIDADYPFEYPTDRVPVLCHALDQILERIEALLRSRNRGAKKIECWLYHETLAPVCIEVGLFRPSGSARHLAKLLEGRLERTPLAEPVCRLRVRVPALEMMVQRQLELFGADSSRLDELGDLIDRLAEQFGREAVTFARLVEDYQPEYACRFEPAIPSGCADSAARKLSPRSRSDGAGAAGPLTYVRGSDMRSSDMRSSDMRSSDGHRPILLWPVPQPIQVLALFSTGEAETPARFMWQGREYTVSRWWGPERIATGWWRSRDVQRDYYQVETDIGTRLWLFREHQDKRWFLHGCFD